MILLQNSDRRGFMVQALAGPAATMLVAAPTHASASSAGFGALQPVRTSLLDIAYAEVGPADGTPVLLVHGWPYDIHTYADVAQILGAQGYAAHTHDFARLIWKTASPGWAFDDAVFARSAAALDNPDHVAISVHNYRWRLGLAAGEACYDAIEAKLATFPAIKVPTITLEGDANGAPHPQPQDYRAKFTGPYQHRTSKGGIGHNLPQEAPQDFARAIVDADRMAG